MSQLPLPPGPAGSFQFQNVRRFQRDPLAYYEALRAEWGDLVMTRVGPIHFVLASAPEAIRHILVDAPERYTKRGLVGDLRPLLGEGSLTAAGERWKRHRGAVSPLLSSARVAALRPVIQEAVETTLGEISETRGWSPYDAARRLALRAILGTLVGRRFEDEPLEAIGQDVEQVSELLMRRRSSLLQLPLSWPFGINRRLRGAMRRLRGVARAEVQPPRTPFLEALAERLDPGTGAEGAALHDEFLTLLIAGHETTATTLAFCLEFLAHHPETQNRLAGGDGGEPLLDAVISETLRLRPPAWFLMRRSETHDEVLGHCIPRNAFVTVSPWVIHRHPDHWTESERFLPERFLEGAAATRYAYIPFGAGERLCPGRAFAETELRLVIPALLERWRLQPTSALSAPRPLATLRPPDSLRLDLVRR